MKRSVKIIFGSIIVMFFALNASAQNIDTLWTANYWQGGWDSVNCLIETSDGGFLMAGMNQDSATYDRGVLLIKTDSLGNEEWTKIISDTANDECAFHVLEDYDGGYLVSASSYGLIGTYLDQAVWIIKTDSNGDTLWTHPLAEITHGGYPLWATITYDSGYAITGLYNYSYDNKAFLLRLDKNGNFVRCTDYFASDNSQGGYYITEMADDSGFIIAGQDNNYYETGWDYWAIRTDSMGIHIWDSTYAHTDTYDMLYGACKVDDGIVMVGHVAGGANAMKIDFDGNTIWNNSISLAFTNEKKTTVCPAPDNGVMVGGWVGVAGQRRDHSFIRLDSLGDTLWTFSVGGSDDDHGRSVVMTSDGGYAMVGTSSSFVNGGSFWLTKIGDAPLCGDPDGSGGINVLDLTFLIEYLYLSGPAPDPLYVGDFDGSGVINVLDITYLISYLYLGGPAPDCL